MTTLDALETSRQIKSTYRRYLQSLLPLRDARLRPALEKAIDETPMLDKGPYLEATPPYKAGVTLAELIAEGVVSGLMADLAGPALPLNRPLHVHQERAVRKARAGRNIVVATGTGSGKTEAFLLPILDALLREFEQGVLKPGVRALLLYPMNALANDQMKRLRRLLASYPAITFGRYTGDTEQQAAKAQDRFHDLNAGEPLLPNELLSREEMRESPPHLLLTNYAMLEYLLLRPQDLDLFEGEHSGTWRFLVVDEAHVYDGTQGAEIAMLLRRLRDRVAPDRAIQCIATSATVGGDASPAAVTTFASRLFGQPFEWVEGDTSRQDLVLAERIPAPAGPFWGPLTPEELSAFTIEPDAMKDLAAGKGFAARDDVHALAHEQNVATLRTLLASGPQPVSSLAAKLFAGEADPQASLSTLVSLASGYRSADGTAALAARYHLFIRATEGAFTCLNDSETHLHLSRRTQCDECTLRAFELGSCKRCGAAYLVGFVERREGRLYFEPRRNAEARTWLLLGDEPLHVDEDEDAVEEESSNVDADAANLCAGCGGLHEGSVLTARTSLGASRAVPVVRQRSGCLKPAPTHPRPYSPQSSTSSCRRGRPTPAPACLVKGGSCCRSVIAARLLLTSLRISRTPTRASSGVG
jgi:ATP-dependent helicase YprA (DUF1998 family)